MFCLAKATLSCMRSCRMLITSKRKIESMARMKFGPSNPQVNRLPSKSCHTDGMEKVRWNMANAVSTDRARKKTRPIQHSVNVRVIWNNRQLNVSVFICKCEVSSWLKSEKMIPEIISVA